MESLILSDCYGGTLAEWCKALLERENKQKPRDPRLIKCQTVANKTNINSFYSGIAYLVASEITPAP